MTSSPRRALACLGLGLLLLQLAWVAAVPPFVAIDEIDHAYRAASIAGGEVGPSDRAAPDGRGDLVRVSSELPPAAEHACEALTYVGPDNCRAVPGSTSDGRVDVASAAARYNPVSYTTLVPAWWLAGGTTGLVLARVLGALVCTVLLLWAASLLLGEGPRRGWAILGLWAACTPVLLYATATAAPNGLHYCAAVLLWAALLAMRADTGTPRSVAAAAAVSGTLVMNTHTLGPLWLGAVVAVTVPLWWPWARTLAREHRGLAVGLVLTWGVAAAWVVSWLVTSGSNDPRAEDTRDLGSAPVGLVLFAHLLWVLQAVATLRARLDFAPPLVYVAAVPALLAVVVLGARAADRTCRRVLVLTLAVALVVPSTLTVLTYDALGPAWQGRYALPVLVGLPMLAALHLPPPPLRPRVLPLVVALLALAQVGTVVAMHVSMRDYAGGPAATPLAVVVVLAAAGALTGACAVWWLRPSAARRCPLGQTS